MALRWSRPREGTPQTLTIASEADGWSACFTGAGGPTHPLPPTGQQAGIALGLAACADAFATPAGGTRIVHPSWSRQADRRLKTAQRRVSRRTRGSHRRRTALTRFV